ncbi:enoyl-CoA hydratase/isomerase family protein [Microbacterium sp.]|uniref:enoyl-CoA hydratase/isomerase family protein n=1 Tax=Microbacterium sp. TaxID=51671 RepID=UPI0039E3784E
MSDSPHVRALVDGHAGRLTLDRPRAINALDAAMIVALRAALDAWEHDPVVAVVVLDGAGERGLCAGGDVRALYDHLVAGRHEQAAEFFRAEYALNARIAEYPKPVVALADGITMGGGIGLAGHARVRVVTERSRLAMPETRIGFTPDVGGSLLLARAPGRLGEYLALTGTTMDAADALAVGLADRLVPSDRLGTLVEALATEPDPADVVARAAVAAPASALVAERTWIDDAFAADTVPEIVDRLHARPEEAASRTARLLGELSPTALAVTLVAVRRARTLPGLRAALEQEYGLVRWFARTQPDLVEGIRAQLVDKDRAPRWSPARPADVRAETVASAFADAPALWG